MRGYISDRIGYDQDEFLECVREEHVRDGEYSSEESCLFSDGDDNESMQCSTEGNNSDSGDDNSHPNDGDLLQWKQHEHQRLLPGIPNDITLGHIAPKLPWRTVHVLSSVSNAWKRAIQSRTVYDDRIRSCSTEAVVVINHLVVGLVKAIGLYSVRDGTICLLPPIPDEEDGLPFEARCVTISGKVYVVGGGDGRSSCKMYVMDVAGQGRWEYGPSMTYARRDFGCGVLNGKIYAVGGWCGRWPENPVTIPEVYDPKFGVWSPMKPMLSFRIGHSVRALGNELFVLNGVRYNPDYLCRMVGLGSPSLFQCQILNPTQVIPDYFDAKDANDPQVDYVEDADFLEVYNEGSDEWRRMERFGKEDEYPREYLFVADGKFHSMTNSGIRVHDIENMSCTDRHSFASADIIRKVGRAPSTYQCIRSTLRLKHALAVENELVAIARWWANPRGPKRRCILQSSGFGGTEITWRKVECANSVGTFQLSRRPSLCSLQL